MDAHSFQNSHVKLLAFDFLSLTPTPSPSCSSGSVSFSRKGIIISRIETLGIVVSRDLKPDKFLRFAIDDGTGCVQCILWLNQLNSTYFSRRCPTDVRLIAQMASMFAGRVQIGVLVRVRGRVGGFRGLVQITVEDVVVERDPNSEILHWLDCMKLARTRYDVLTIK